jgi:hypothetical protein
LTFRDGIIIEGSERKTWVYNANNLNAPAFQQEIELLDWYWFNELISHAFQNVKSVNAIRNGGRVSIKYKTFDIVVDYEVKFDGKTHNVIVSLIKVTNPDSPTFTIFVDNFKKMNVPFNINFVSI